MGSASERRIQPLTYILCFAAFALIVFLSHLAFVGLPLFWDELGYYVPAALDLYRDRAWVPTHTLTTAHPPAISLWLAGFWSVFGYSIPVTRVAMLVLASGAALSTFLLAIQLCRRTPGTPAFAAVALLLVSPLFYTQAMMAQLDMPAMLMTSAALLLFLEDRYFLSAAACTLLVLVKDTSIAVPMVFGAWLLSEKRFRPALLFTAPLLALFAWIAFVHHAGGNVFGNKAATTYNFLYSLQPVRFACALLRRSYFIGFENFHWVGTLAIVMAWKRTRHFATRPWKIAGAVFLAQVMLVTTFGGAELERYLLPVLPLFYIATASAWTVLPAKPAHLSQAVMVFGLVASSFWNPPYWPFPYENNLAMTDFVYLHRTAAEFLERHYPGSTIATAWPLTDALRRPEFGYVHGALEVRETSNFQPSDLTRLDARTVDVFVLYSRQWDPPWSVLRIPAIERIWIRYFQYQAPITPGQCAAQLGMKSVARWQRHGQWVEIFARKGPHNGDIPFQL